MAEKKLELKIGGMHCAACSARIEKVVGNLQGIETCSVNLATEQAQVNYDPSVTGLATIQDAVGNLGFFAEEKSEENETTLEDGKEKLRVMRARLVPSFVLALLIMAISMGHMIGLTLPRQIDPSSAPLAFGLIQFVLLLPVLWMGRNFYLTGIPALLRKVPNMDSLIALGTGAAFIYSTWNLVEIGFGIDAVARAHDLYFESAAMLIALVSLGKYFEAKSKARTTDAIRQLMQLAPEKATLLQDGEQVQIPVVDIVVGNHILIRPGERVPVDGVIIDGSSSVDESMLTGESLPLAKKAGDDLFSGTLNKNGEETVLARIVQLVRDAQGSKAPIANLADRISLYFVPTVMTIALVAGLSWYLIGDAGFSYSLRIFIAVLVIACPCAMGLATPTSIMVGTGRGAQLGVLVKNGEVLELAGKVSCVVFDKTGTLTRGTPALTDSIILDDFDEELLLSLVAGAELKSEHPLAESLVEAARMKGYTIQKPHSFAAIQGQGVEAEIEISGISYHLFIGNSELARDKDPLRLSVDIEKQARSLAEDGKTVLYVVVNTKLAAMLAVADPLKAEAAETVKQLKSMGLKVVMLTGDNEETAAVIAKQAGIKRVIAGVLPDRKESEVARLQESGDIVVMVGDGINDAPALARADVGIGMGTGIDVAIDSADIVLIKGDLAGVTTAIRLSRATMHNIKQNLFWAFGYNVVGIPVAAGLLAVFGGPTLNPMVAGAAMAFSSVSVVTNALRLRWFNSGADQ